MVKYYYDAWGRCYTVVVNDTASEIANLNPFRYRSYYLDTETNLYYLKTRYYDPTVGRFITIDDISYLDSDTINGLNLYAYCGNNPVMRVDPTGQFPIIALLIGLGIGLVAGAISGGITSAINGNSGWALVGDVIAGALSGAALGAATTLGGLVGIGAISGITAAVSLGVSTIASYAIGTASNAISEGLRGNDINPIDSFNAGKNLALKSLLNFGIGFLYGASGSWSTLNEGIYTNLFKEFRYEGYNIAKSLIGAEGHI